MPRHKGAARTRTLSFRLSADLEEKIEKLCAEKKLSRADLLEQAVLVLWDQRWGRGPTRRRGDAGLLAYEADAQLGREVRRLCDATRPDDSEDETEEFWG